VGSEAAFALSNLRAGNRPQIEAHFFAVANDGYFPAAAAMLNSLRLTGHDHEVVFGDCGLQDDQRARLEAHSRIVEIPAGERRDPTLLKSFPHAFDVDGVLVFIDSDMIVTDDLTPVLELAADGKICAFADPELDRRFEEWGELFGLSHELRPQEFISAGFVAWSHSHWPNLLGRWRELCEQIPPGATLGHGATNLNPLAQGDQDALNALLMSEIPRDAVVMLPDDERPVWRTTQVRVVDARTLACRLDGHATKLVHADGSRKPWQTRMWWRVRNDAYVRLFRRLIFADDAVVSVEPAEVPIWLRPTTLGTSCLQALNAVNAVTSFVFRRRATRYIAKHVKAARRELRARRELQTSNA
jgi:hypothetical protein